MRRGEGATSTPSKFGGLDTDVDPKRFARLCKRHGRVLAGPEGLECPGARGSRGRPHLVEKWVVVDLERRRAYSTASVEGHERELQQPLEEVVHMTENGKREQRTLQRAKLKANGRVLWLRVEINKGKDEDTRYRVRWQQETGSGKSKESTTGVVAVAATEDAASDAFDRELEKAKRAGWRPAAVGTVGPRPLKLRAVPPPPVEADE